MKKVMHGLLFSLTLFSVQSNADSPYLDGEFTVSGGQANYNVSLELPKGRAGYTPSLAIAYNSNGANNELGLGWQIEGKSTIARCARTLSTDGQWGGVKFDDNDRYCVNGKRLIAITGKDGAHLTEYRTEVDDGNKYVSFNKVGSGPEYFKVWTPDGEEHTYGGTADSKLVLAGNVLSWDISQDRDNSNNLINYTYLTDNNIKYLSAVNYVGGKVHFNYVDRKDYVTKYFLGYKQIRKKRLNDITISNNYNQVVNKYTLSYKYADTSGLSLITAISKSISGYEITPIKIHWSYMPSSTGPSVNHILNVANPILYDKERDGVFETVSHSNHQTLGIWGNEGLTTLKNCDSSTGCYVADNNGDGINNLSKSRLYDMNGDGKTDGLGYGNVLDINNDGLMDSYTYLSGREDWTGCGKHECQKWLNYSSLNVNLQNSQLNLLYYCSTSGGNCRYSDYLYHSSKFKDVAFYDMNNDGYKDILFKLYDAPNYRIMINNGNRFEAPVELSNTANLISQVLDINHDGINELILKDRHGRDHQIVYLTPEINKVKTVKHYNGNAYYADVNSDGIYEKITVNDNKYTSIIRFTPNVFHVDTIETYADKIDISYAAISNKNVHKQKVHFDFPVINTTPSLIVVNRIKNKTGTTRYEYVGAKSHVNGGGFLGFESITSKHYSNDGIATEVYSKYEQYRDVGGKVKKLPTGKLIYQTKKINNKILSEEWAHYTHKVQTGYDGKYSYQIRRTENTAKYQDDMGYNLGLIQKTYAYNDVGRIVKTVTSKSLSGQPTFTQVDETSYLSSGLPTYKVINQAQNSASSHIAKNLAHYDHLDVWCGSDGLQYIKPRNKFILIHGEIVTPILVGDFPYFYRLNVASHSSNITSNTQIKNTSFTAVSQSEFTSKSPQLCGEYYVYDYNGDGLQDLVSQKGSLTTLVSESGKEFWKTNAIKQRTTTVTFNGLTQQSMGSMSYDTRGRLLAQRTQSSDYGTASMGAKSLIQQFQYDDYGNVISETTGGTNTASRTDRTTYDSYGIFPVSTSNALGHTTTYEYDQRFGFVTAVTDPNNRVTRNAYDVYGRLQQTWLPGSNNWVKYSYRLGNNCEAKANQAISCILTEKNGRGKTITQFDQLGREVRNIHQSFDGRWVYEDQSWDSLGRKLRHSRPSFEKPDPSMSNVPHSQFRYDSLDREVYSKVPSDSGNGWHESQIVYQGLKEIYTESKAGGTYTKTVTKNLLGQIIKVDEPLGASQTYTYYPDGKLKTTTDSANNTTTVQYDNLGYRKLLIDPDLGTLYYDHNAFGELVYTRDANDRITRITYDQLGRKTHENISGIVSTWEYDRRGKGLLYRQQSPGNTKELFYNNGLLVEEKMVAKGQTLVQRYKYDSFERIAEEIRPNDLVLQYIYNEFGYHSAVRSPKSAADSIFTSLSFQQDVRALINAAASQAQKYLNLADRYAQQRDFYQRKANEIKGNSVDIYELDVQSLNLLNGAQRFRKYCNNAGACYLQPATWLILHDEVSIPLDVTLDQYYRLTQRYSRTRDGNRYYDTTVYAASSDELNNSGATQQEDWVLKDHDNNGSLDLIAGKHLYGAYKDASTKQEINFTAQELTLASEIANTRYQTYRQLAEKLVVLSQQVAKLSGLYKQDEQNTNKQKAHLQTIVHQSELAKADKNAFIYYWQRTNTDAYDHTTSEVLGNGLANSYVHSEKTGRARIIATHKASHVVSQSQLSNHQFTKNGYRQIYYNYDNWGNVTQRYDRSLGLNERFTYDLLDRVTSATPMLDDQNQHGAGNPDFNRRFEYHYDRLGNITYKTGIGHYEYRSSHKHAVTQAGDIQYDYDAAGNMVRATKQDKEERSIVWTSFNKPERITRNGHITSFEYDANHARFYREDSNGKQTLYLGKTYEQILDTKTKHVEHKQYIYADGKLIALHVSEYDNQRNLKDKQIRYLHYDALSSVDLITDGYGNIVERRSYDSWGKARKLLWQDPHDPATLVQLSLTTRGFTGHEHLEEVGLIHMNGRVYDADIGRFISPDPVVQAPFMTNSFNRYSYVMNNPLKYVDPTGYLWGDDFGSTCNTDGSIRNSKGDRIGSWRNNDHGVDITYDHDNGKTQQNYKNEVPDYWSGGPTTNIEYGFSLFNQEDVADFVYNAFFSTLEDIHKQVTNTIDALNTEQPWQQKASIIATHVASGTFFIVSKKVKVVERVADSFWDVTNSGRKFWTSSTTFKGNKVFQRNDLIDPKLVDARGRTNLERMQKGLAPVGPDGKSVNLHHMTQKHNGSIAEVTQIFHQKNSKTIHINPSSTPSGIDRSAFNKWRIDYWKSRANDF